MIEDDAKPCVSLREFTADDFKVTVHDGEEGVCNYPVQVLIGNEVDNGLTAIAGQLPEPFNSLIGTAATVFGNLFKM